MNLAGWTKQLSGKPVITVGSVGLNTSFVDDAGLNMAMSTHAGVAADSIAQLAQRVSDNEFELVAVGRALIQDPEWILKVKNNQLDQLQGYSKDSLMTLV